MAAVGAVGVTAVSVTSLLLAIPPVAGASPATVGYAGPATDVGQSPLIVNGSHKFTSRNWDGYITYSASEETDFTAVKASWIVPTVTCEAKNAWTVFWVGLDGWFNDTVEQGGSQAQCSAVGGAATYSLWWEMYPTNSIQTVLTISAGDEVTASVKYATTTSTFTIKVSDETTGKSFTRKEQCASGVSCQRSSADVITEDVGHYPGSGYFPLADYGTMGYTNADMTDPAGQSGAISSKHWLNAAVTESDAGTTYASVSSLADGGTAFNAVWRHR
jgi:hypothetical protein